jgi:hypothetical protein
MGYERIEADAAQKIVILGVILEIIMNHLPRHPLVMLVSLVWRHWGVRIIEQLR